jgi:Protein of unknown function (DUF3987)
MADLDTAFEQANAAVASVNGNGAHPADLDGRAVWRGGQSGVTPADPDGLPPWPDLDGYPAGRGHYPADLDGDDEPGGTLAPVPAFPVADLRGPLADLVSSTEFPAPLVAGWGLGILAGLAGLADVTIEDSLPLAGPLWIMCIAKRGRAKTPSFDYAARTLRGLEVEARRQWKREVADWNSADPEDRGDFPTDPLRLFDDITVEGCARLLDRRDGTGLVPVDELAGWVGRMGRYGNAGGSSERARWLSMWSSQPWAYQRVGDGKGGGLAVDIFIERPVVSIVGGIQPALLGTLGSDQDGFPPRWLPFWYDGPKLPWARRIHVPAKWDAAVGALYDARGRREWKLTGAGLRMWREAAGLWARQAEGDEASATSAALDKADIQCAAIAKVIAESMHPGRGGVIPVEAVSCAVALVNYCMDVWRAMPGNQSMSLSRKDEVLNQGVNELASWLEDRAPRDLNGRSVRWATPREITRGHVAGVRTSEQARLLIDHYRAVYPGCVVDYRPAGGGRPGRAVMAPQRDGIAGKSAGEFVARRQTPDGRADGSESVFPLAGEVSAGGVSLGNVATNPLATNSGDKLWRQTPVADSDGGAGPVACSVCGGDLDAALVAAGLTDHGEQG